MKKIFKIFRIIALATVIGFFMADCKDDNNYPASPKQFITVTDIPPTYNGKYGVLLLSPPGSSIITAYSPIDKINETSFTFPLYNWKNDNPWEGKGSYSIKILIYENTMTEQWIYAGVISNESEEENITEKTTTIEWSSFTDKTSIVNTKDVIVRLSHRLFL